MMHSKDEFVTVHIGRSTWQGLKSELNPNSENPERIWAYAWTGKEGFQGQWDYFDTSPYYGKVTEYVRADLYDALAKERDEEAEHFRQRWIGAIEQYENAIAEIAHAGNLRKALQDIIADRPSMKHNGNRNDQIAWKMWRRARAALRKEAYE